MSSAQTQELTRSAFWKAAGQLLRMLRERHGWSYHELATRAGVTADLVVAYELARVRYPELEACWRITTALGVDLPAFLRQAEQQSGTTLLAGVQHPNFTAPTVPDNVTASPQQTDELADFIDRLRPRGGGDKPQ